jgi:membrane associated rhomboid family serine protease
MSGTYLVLLLTILVSLLGFLSPRFLDATLMRPYRIAQGADYHTLIMSGFVHDGLPHLLLNLLALFLFGPSLEHEIGTSRFLLLYVAGLVVSDLGTCVRHHNDPQYATLGASGAILAVVFASIVYFPQQNLMFLLLPVPIPAPLFAVGYLAYSYFASRKARPAVDFPPPGTAPGPDGAPSPLPGSQAHGRAPLLPFIGRTNHDGHIFGALTGLVFVLLMDPQRFEGMVRYFSSWF